MTTGDAPTPEGSSPSPASASWRNVGVVAIVLALVLIPGFSLSSATNFGGYDEWLIASLTSQGIVSFPYANRPLSLAWALPGVPALPSTLTGYLAVHLGYLLAIGLIVFGIARRLGRGDMLLALLAGAAAVAWVPLDQHRLNPLNNLMYSGATCAALLGLLLFLEWAVERGTATLLAGILAALLASRSYEGTLGLLALGAPLLLIPVARDLRRPLWRTLLAWEGPMLGLAVLAVAPLIGSGAGSYQVTGLGLDTSVSGVLGRLAQQLRWHLEPLLTTLPAELVSWRVAIATAGFAVGSLLLFGRASRAAEPARLARVALSGLALAVAGWFPMLLTAAIAEPARMQGFSAPGVGLALGAAVCLVASMAGRRWRAPVAALLGCWIVAAGTARTLALQRGWDRDGFWPAQARLLRQLVEIAPDLRPSTLVVLLDNDRVFQTSFPFRHAVKFLYEGRALGMVPEENAFLYPARFEAGGVVSEPWPAIRGPWREPVTRHGYDEVLAVRHSGGRLHLLEQWPLGGAADGEARRRYAPRSRIVPGSPPPRSAILEGPR